MAKNQNAFAKRQREAEKKRKAELKRERRAKSKQLNSGSGASNDPSALCTSAEYSVLGIFRKYLMTPGKMLCLNSSDLETYDMSLTQLIDKGLLVAEESRGGYSLTASGFVAMSEGE